MMTPERYRQVGHLYHTALELNPEARGTFLDNACGDDEELRQEVESLLKAYDKANNYFAAPALEVAARLLGERKGRSLEGHRLGHYQVLSLIGAGGMGEVYLAEDTRLGRKVALKMLAPAFTRDQERLRRFEREARLVSALNHPNILTIYEVGVAGENHFIATEFIDGQTLRERLRDGRVELSEALDIASQTANALAAAHETGIVHRDIKPENVMARRDGIVKVLDFGLAKLNEQRLVEQPTLADGEIENKAQVSTDAGVVLGTVTYMSPEQARGQKVDARSDIFSLGVMLYEMIAGQPPFGGETATDVIISIVQQEPAPLPEVPPELERIVVKALSKDREERYQTATEMLGDLKGLRQRLEFETVSGSVRESAASGARSRGELAARRIWQWALAAAMVVLLAAGGLWLARRTRETAANVEPPVIAVLPFENRSVEKESEYFADGLTDELIRNLSIIEGLEVRSRISSFAFKDKKRDLREIGEKLKVNWVLDGSVLRAGSSLRITAQLIRVSDDKPFWTGKFELETKDIFKIQGDISLGIVNQLRLKLGRGRRRYETSVEAYDLYLRARSDFFYDGPDRKGRIRKFERAIELDPSFAPAYAGLASVYSRNTAFVVDYNPDELVKMREAADKAIQLDPLLPEAHAALGLVSAREGRWEQAENSFRQAIKLDPNRPATRAHFVRWLLGPLGRKEEALEQLYVAETADPLSEEIQQTLTFYLISARRYDEAAVHCQKLPANNSYKDVFLARARFGQGKSDEAIQLATKDLTSVNPQNRAYAGCIYARAGRREEAEKLVAASRFPNEQALLYACLGDRDRALKSLEAMSSRGPQRIGYFLGFPEMDLLRNDPRVATLRKKVGLPE